eukprot:1024718-Pyramimonas_sp.AAC.1
MRKWAIFSFGFRRRGNSSSPRLGTPSKSWSERPRPSKKEREARPSAPGAPSGAVPVKGGAALLGPVRPSATPPP